MLLSCCVRWTWPKQDRNCVADRERLGCLGWAAASFEEAGGEATGRRNILPRTALGAEHAVCRYLGAAGIAVHGLPPRFGYLGHPSKGCDRNSINPTILQRRVSASSSKPTIISWRTCDPDTGGMRVPVLVNEKIDALLETTSRSFYPHLEVPAQKNSWTNRFALSSCSSRRHHR